MSAIVEETEAERQAIRAVRMELQRRLDSGELPLEEAAERLGLVAAGLESLLLRDWTFPQAFRVARAVGIDFAETLH